MTTRKICNGPAHERPIELPVTDRYWYFHKSGKKAGQPLHYCKTCSNFHRLKNPTKTNQGTVPAEQVLPILQEIIARVGKSEAARLIEVSPNTNAEILNGSTKRVQKKTAARMINTLRQLRKGGVIRHRKSIRHGSKLRDRKERKVRKVNEQNGSIFPELEAAEREKDALRKQAERRGMSLEEWVQQKEDEGRCV